MRTTIDAAGRVVVPKALRDELGLQAGQEIEASVRDGRLEIEIPPAELHLKRRRGGVVAVPTTMLPTLTAALVRRTLERTRR